MTIRLESIRIVATTKNYESVNHALFVLDCVLSGSVMEDEDDSLMKLNKKEQKLLVTLFAENPELWTLDHYIIDTFNAYRRNKKLIKVVWFMIADQYDEAVYGLITQSGIQEFHRDSKELSVGSSNLLSVSILKVFGFVENLIILHHTCDLFRFCVPEMIFLLMFSKIF